MSYSDLDCPRCKGLGDLPAGTVYRLTGPVPRTRRCRRCRGTGLI